MEQITGTAQRIILALLMLGCTIYILYSYFVNTAAETQKKTEHLAE